jgi:FtsZ-binding cell division protein ZapB
MSLATYSSVILVSETVIRELKSQQDKFTSQVSTLAAAVNLAKERQKQLKFDYDVGQEHIQHLQMKYDASQECLQNLNYLISKASTESAATKESSAIVATAKDLEDGLEIPRVTMDAVKLIRVVLETHFSDKVNMDTFAEEMGSSGSFEVCNVYLKDLPSSYLSIWYNVRDSFKVGGRAVICGCNVIGECSRLPYTTVGELKVAIASTLAEVAQLFEKKRQSLVPMIRTWQ